MSTTTQEKNIDPEETTYSSEDEKLDETTSRDPPNLSGLELAIEHDGFPWRDIVVCGPQGETLYFADISEFTRGKADIELRAHSKEGSLVAVSHFRRALSIQCGLGSDELNMDWIEMKREGSLWKMRYEFPFEGKNYTLRRTRDVGSGMDRVLKSHYEVVEEGSGDAVATYVGRGFGQRKGTLTLAEGLSPALQTLIVLGIASWREKARRRQSNAGAMAGANTGAFAGAY